MQRFLPAAVLLFALACSMAFAAPTPVPVPTINAEQFNKHLKESLQKHVVPTPMVPTQPLRVVLVVETNKKGQVTRVRGPGSHGSNNDTFNAMCYGNALQVFIRTEDGRAIPGTYKLIYDYSPDSRDVRRTVEMIKSGGVNPDAIGAVDDMAKQNMKKMREDRAAWERAVQRAKEHPSPKPDASATH